MTHDTSTAYPGTRLENLLRHVVASLASDLHLAGGKEPVVRVNSELRSVDTTIASNQELEAGLEALMNDAQRAQWKAAGHCVFVHSIAKLARFRIRMFTQYRGVGAAIRILPHKAPELAALKLPDAFKAALNRPTGLILVTGSAGSGRTTTLAAALLAIGRKGRGRMVSIGQTVEFALTDRLPDLIQIDLTQTAGTYAAAIRKATSAGARVIVVDDGSDPATIIEALQAAQQACLVLCGLRVADTRSAIDKIISRCPEGEKAGYRLLADTHYQNDPYYKIYQGALPRTKGEETGRWLLADTLRITLGQRWIRTVRGGRTLAFEVSLGTPALRNCIRQLGIRFSYYSMLQTHVQLGFQTFDHHLHWLFREGHISRAEAASHRENPYSLGGCGSDDGGVGPYENTDSAPAIPSGVFAPEVLDDPKVFEHVARYREGLIVVSGLPSSGRSATATYLLSLAMARRRRHIVTIESRVEHAFEESLIGLGPVTRHVLPTSPVDLADAVGAALGEDPDLLFLALEPNAQALTLLLDAAHSGVLVMIVLPAPSAVAAIEYLKDRIPASEGARLHHEYTSYKLRAVFAQRLMPRVDGGHVAVYEILLGTPAVRNLITERRFEQLQSCIMAGQPYGMQTFAQHLARLVKAGTVRAEDARLDEL